MSTLDDILSRALLAPERTMPRDIVRPRGASPGLRPATAEPEASDTTAAADLRALCETVIRHTPATTVGAFVTDQVPEPRSALVLACVLELTDTNDGARFWWQYAAGAGQPAAAYCLYLHHLALGETRVASWWHRQTNEVQPYPGPRSSRKRTSVHWKDDEVMPAVLQDSDGASTTTLLHVLRRLATDHAPQPRSAAVTELMAYMPIAVAVGYLREPDSELPLPGPDFACQIHNLLAAATERPDSPSDLPARPPARPTERRANNRTEERNQHVDEAATR
ncbi:hypothetical protein ACIPWL_30215 [Streptomyces sp. NPDC090023]|uniref:hypothetical protein n=1 Tax=unclassified Streptomyces TaxID=2593676 RepID=UPI0037F7B178